MIGTFWEDKNHFVMVLSQSSPNTWRVVDVYNGCVNHMWAQDGRLRVIDKPGFPWLTRIKA
jgi:hypothetical protein